MKVGYLQFRPLFGRVQRNLNKVIKALHQVNADLIVLPELAFTGYYFKDRRVSYILPLRLYLFVNSFLKPKAGIDSVKKMISFFLPQQRVVNLSKFPLAPFYRFLCFGGLSWDKV